MNALLTQQETHASQHAQPRKLVLPAASQLHCNCVNAACHIRSMLLHAIFPAACKVPPPAKCRCSGRFPATTQGVADLGRQHTHRPCGGRSPACTQPNAITRLTQRLQCSNDAGHTRPIQGIAVLQRCLAYRHIVHWSNVWSGVLASCKAMARHTNNVTCSQC